jgi:chemotaxis protein histidine kinase CheA
MLPKVGPHKVVHDDHTIVHPPTTLRDKALSKVRQSPKEFEESIVRAERALEALTPSFTEWMLSETRRLAHSFAAFEDSARDDDAVQALFMVAHDVRGQAKQFGYPIAAHLAEGLCDLLKSGSGEDMPITILRSYVDSISSMVRFGVRDEANEVALELSRSLARLVAEYRHNFKPAWLQAGTGHGPAA